MRLSSADARLLAWLSVKMPLFLLKQIKNGVLFCSTAAANEKKKGKRQIMLAHLCTLQILFWCY